MSDDERLASFSDLVDSSFCDVSFTCRNPAGDNEESGEATVGAVRAILAAQSPVFRALLFSGFTEGSQSEIELPFRAEAFRAFVRYLHGGPLPADDDDVGLLCELLHLSDHFDAQAVKVAVSGALERQLNLQTAFPLLAHADACNAAVVKATCLEFIACNAGRLFLLPTLTTKAATGSVTAPSKEPIIDVAHVDEATALSEDPLQLSVLSPELFVAILERDDLDAEEYALYRSVLRWAELRVKYGHGSDANSDTFDSDPGCQKSAGAAASDCSKSNLNGRVLRLARPLLAHIRFAFIPARELKHDVFPSAVVPADVVVSALAWQLGCDDYHQGPPPTVSLPRPSPLPPTLSAAAAAAHVADPPGPGASAYASRAANPEILPQASTSTSTWSSTTATSSGRAPFHGGLPAAGEAAEPALQQQQQQPALLAAARAAIASCKALTPRRPKLRKVAPAALAPRKGWTLLPGPKALCPDTHNGGAAICEDRLIATYGNDGSSGSRLRIVALDSGREMTVELPFSTRGAVPTADVASGWCYCVEDSDRLPTARAARFNVNSLELQELPPMPARHCRFAGAAVQAGRFWTLTRPGLLTCYDPRAEQWTSVSRVPGSAALLAADPADVDKLWLLHSSGKLRRYSIAINALTDVAEWPGTYFSLTASRPFVAMPRIGGGVLLASHACHAWHVFDSLTERWHHVAGWPECELGAHCAYDVRRGRLLFQQRGKSHWQWVQLGT